MKSCVAGPCLFISRCILHQCCPSCFLGLVPRDFLHTPSSFLPQDLCTCRSSSWEHTPILSSDKASSDPGPQYFRVSFVSPYGRYHKWLCIYLYGYVFSVSLSQQTQSRWWLPWVCLLLPIVHSPPGSAWYRVDTQNRVVEPKTWTSARGLCRPPPPPGLCKTADCALPFSNPRGSPRLPVQKYKVISSLEWSYHRSEVCVQSAFLSALDSFSHSMIRNTRPWSLVVAVTSCNEITAVAIFFQFAFFLVGENLQLLVSGAY